MLIYLEDDIECVFDIEDTVCVAIMLKILRIMKVIFMSMLNLLEVDVLVYVDVEELLENSFVINANIALIHH